MRITARQLRVQDVIVIDTHARVDGTNGVAVTEVPEGAQSATDLIVVQTIDAGGRREPLEFLPNRVLTVWRHEVDGGDPLANVYWWGLEREHEQAEDRRQAEHEQELEGRGIWI